MWDVQPTEMVEVFAPSGEFVGELRPSEALTAALVLGILTRKIARLPSPLGVQWTELCSWNEHVYRSDYNVPVPKGKYMLSHSFSSPLSLPPTARLRSQTSTLCLPPSAEC